MAFKFSAQSLLKNKRLDYIVSLRQSNKVKKPIKHQGESLLCTDISTEESFSEIIGVNNKISYDI